jgi:hypothetical protein
MCFYCCCCFCVIAQGWQPSAVGPGEWLISFAGKAGIRLHLGQQGTATGRLELLEPAAADIGSQLLAAVGG